MSSDNRVSIGQVKRDISALVNRVAYGGERIVLTSRGKPKAALVSIEDYERLREEQIEENLVRWQAWLTDSDRLAEEIMARRDQEPFEIDGLWQEARADLESRDEQILGR